MSPLNAVLIAIGSICLAMGLICLVIGRRMQDAPVYIWFALAALFAAANAFVEPLAYGATTTADLNRIFKWAIIFQGLCWISLVWYVAYYARSSRRWLAVAVTAGYAVALVVHVSSPFGLLFTGISEVVRLRLPWGEFFSLARGAPNPWRIVGDLTTLLLIAFVLDAIIGLVRRGQRRRALRLGAATTFLLLALLHGSLVDLLVVRTPYAISLGFLFAVMIMGLDLANEAARASQLEFESGRRERRWKVFLDGIRLLVVRTDGDGRLQYVNPHFCDVVGLPSQELIGRLFADLIADGDLLVPAASSASERSDLQGVTLEEGRLVTADGSERVVLWSNVILSAQDGPARETLAVGVDITERRHAETARDDAMRELDALKRRLEEENLYLRQEIRVERDFEGIVGESDALLYVLHRVEQVAETETTVLILGETGVGKELVARAIHDASARKLEPFVRLNCANLPDNLVESELFGHEAGAFTGATGLRKGRFELADGGTIFLDEIAELPQELQGKLLRVLQEGEFERVGSSMTRHTDVRVLAATNRDLALEVEQGRFRADLFYRINVYPITVPPLRDRREDVAALVTHFVNRIARRHGRTITEVPASVMHELSAYDWPGNVRELQNVLERAVITSPESELRLPEALTVNATRQQAQVTLQGVRLRSLRDVERHHILAVLESTDGRVAGSGGAAEVLGLHANTLRSRMKKLGIPRGAGRATAEGTPTSG